MINGVDFGQYIQNKNSSTMSFVSGINKPLRIMFFFPEISFQVAMFRAYLPSEASVKSEPNEHYTTFPKIESQTYSNVEQDPTDSSATAGKPIKLGTDSDDVKSRNPFAKKFIGSRLQQVTPSVKVAKKISKQCLKSAKYVSKESKSHIPMIRKPAFELLYEILKTGDRSNRGLSSMYFADVPLYKRKFRLNLIIGRDRFSKESRKYMRYFRSKKIKAIATPVNFNLRTQGIRIDAPFDFVPCTNDIKKSDERPWKSSLDCQIEQLNMAITFDPKNLNCWMSLCDLQVDIENASSVNSNHNPLEGLLSNQNSAERQLSVLEKALHHLPGSDTLMLRKLSLLHHLRSNMDEARQEWKSFLITCPNNLEAWSKFFHFMIYISKYDLETVISSFSTCFRYLIGMKIETFKSHSLLSDENDVVKIVLQLLYFLYRAGHIEKCIALAQYLVEFNFLLLVSKTEGQSTLDSKGYEKYVTLMEEYFKSGVPKIGEAGYIGLNQWVDLSNQVGEFSCSNSENQSKAPPIETFLKAELPVWKNWIALERARSVYDVFPVRSQNEDSEDPERFVSFAFIRQFLFPFDKRALSLIESIFLLLINLTSDKFEQLILSELFLIPSGVKNIHIINICPSHDYAPDVMPIFEHILTILQQQCNKANVLETFLKLASIKTKAFSNEGKIPKRLREILKMPGNCNNLNIWKLLLQLEFQCGNLSVVTKTVSSLSKMMSAETSGDSNVVDYVRSFKLDCAILVAGLNSFDMPCKFVVLKSIIVDSDLQLEQFRQADAITVKLIAVKTLIGYYDDNVQFINEFDLDQLLGVCAEINKPESKEECLKILCVLIFKLLENAFFTLRNTNEALVKIASHTNNFCAYQALVKVNSKPFRLSLYRRLIDKQLLSVSSSDQSLKLFMTSFVLEKSLMTSEHENISRIRSVLERSLHKHCHAPVLWESYLDFSLKYSRNVEDVLERYHRAMNHVPLNKKMCMSFLPYFPEQLEITMKLMIDRKLRVKTPVEEVELYLNEILPSLIG